MGWAVNVGLMAGCQLFFYIAWYLDHYDYKVIPGWAGNRRAYDVQKALDESETNLVSDNVFVDYESSSDSQKIDSKEV